jgi:uridine kinase/hydroxymethylpyrimidine pyrophosphatase-like HAD family hydrolase
MNLYQILFGILTILHQNMPEKLQNFEITTPMINNLEHEVLTHPEIITDLETNRRILPIIFSDGDGTLFDQTDLDGRKLNSAQRLRDPKHRQVGFQAVGEFLTQKKVPFIVVSGRTVSEIGNLGLVSPRIGANGEMLMLPNTQQYREQLLELGFAGNCIEARGENLILHRVDQLQAQNFREDLKAEIDLLSKQYGQTPFNTLEFTEFTEFTELRQDYYSGQSFNRYKFEQAIAAKPSLQELVEKGGQFGYDLQSIVDMLDRRSSAVVQSKSPELIRDLQLWVLQNGYKIHSYGDKNMDISVGKIDKGMAIQDMSKILSRIYNIDKILPFGVGDAANDLPMAQECVSNGGKFYLLQSNRNDGTLAKFADLPSDAFSLVGDANKTGPAALGDALGLIKGQISDQKETVQQTIVGNPIIALLEDNQFQMLNEVDSSEYFFSKLRSLISKKSFPVSDAQRLKLLGLGIQTQSQHITGEGLFHLLDVLSDYTSKHVDQLHVDLPLNYTGIPYSEMNQNRLEDIVKQIILPIINDIDPIGYSGRKVVCINGASGTGKSTVLQAIKSSTKVTVIDSDKFLNDHELLLKSGQTAYDWSSRIEHFSRVMESILDGAQYYQEPIYDRQQRRQTGDYNPVSLNDLVVIDSGASALNFPNIEIGKKALKIILYCRNIKIPLFRRLNREFGRKVQQLIDYPESYIADTLLRSYLRYYELITQIPYYDLAINTNEGHVSIGKSLYQTNSTIFNPLTTK